MKNAETATPVDRIVIRLREQREHDLKAIRAAMVEHIDNFDTYSTVADKADEATLEGMRSMLVLFDVQARWLESL